MKPRKEVRDSRTGEVGPCLPIVIWHGFLVDKRVLAHAFLDGSTDDLEGLESYRDYASMPLAVRTELGTKRPNYMNGSIQSHARDCGVVVLWPQRPDYPKEQRND